MPFCLWLQGLPFSTWLNQSSSIWAYPMFLFAHTLGMSVVAGASAMIAFALLGLWPSAPLRWLEGLYPIIWAGFALNAVTGASIFMKDAVIYAANPDFYVKLTFVLAGLLLSVAIRKQVFGNPRLDDRPVPRHAKLLAWASLFCWFAAIVTGRLIAYVGPVVGL